VAAPHLQFLHRANVVELDQAVHRARGQPVAVGVPQYAVDLLLVRVDRAASAWNSNLVQKVNITLSRVCGMQQYGQRLWKTASKNTSVAASPVVHVGIWWVNAQRYLLGNVPDAFSHLWIPQANRRVSRARRNQRALRVPFHALHVALVTQKHLLRFVSARRPHVHPTVVTVEHQNASEFGLVI
jgi:hypothetical protein